jgi:hypothetical protein
MADKTLCNDDLRFDRREILGVVPEASRSTKPAFCPAYALRGRRLRPVQALEVL